MFYAFDLLHLDGKDLTGERLLKRRARLPRVLEGTGLLLSQELPGTAAAIVEAVRGLSLEGVIAKAQGFVVRAWASSTRSNGMDPSPHLTASSARLELCNHQSRNGERSS